MSEFFSIEERCKAYHPNVFNSFCFRKESIRKCQIQQKEKEDEKKGDEKRVKYASVTGFSDKTTPQRLKNLERHPHKGDWRRNKKIKVGVKMCQIMYEYCDVIGEEP